MSAEMHPAVAAVLAQAERLQSVMDDQLTKMNTETFTATDEARDRGGDAQRASLANRRFHRRGPVAPRRGDGLRRGSTRRCRRRRRRQPRRSTRTERASTSWSQRSPMRTKEVLGHVCCSGPTGFVRGQAEYAVRTARMSVPPQGGWPTNQDPPQYGPQTQPQPPGWHQGPWPPHTVAAAEQHHQVASNRGCVLLVVAVSIGATLLFTRGGSGGGGSAASISAVPSDIASANDTGPVAIITEDPTCKAYIDIYNSLASIQSNGWNAERRTLGPSSEWTPDQRSHVQAVVTALRNAAEQIVPLAKQTPHRVMRELYEQFVAYGRGYADSSTSYTPVDGYPGQRQRRSRQCADRHLQCKQYTNWLTARWPWSRHINPHT